MTWIVISTLFVNTVHADDVQALCQDVTFGVPEFERVPEGALFGFVGLKEILTQLECGEYHLRMRSELATELVNEQRKVTILETNEVLLQEIISVQEQENTRLFDKWKEENKKRREAENKPSYSWIGWTAAAVFATSTLAFGTAFVLK